MEAWDDQDRVRPIPIEDDDGFDRGTAEAPSSRAARPWLPLGIAIIAVIVVVASVSVFGALRFDDPEPFDPAALDLQIESGSSTTTTTIPPSLEEAIPGVTDRLTIVSEDSEGVWTLLWDPSFRIPKPVLHSVPRSTDATTTSAAFDRSGQFVAFGTCAEGKCGTYVGPPTDLGTEADIVTNGGFVWHASEVGRIALTHYATDTFQTEVLTGTANPLTGSIDNVEQAFVVAGRVEISHWDNLGFIARGDTTTAYSPDGEMIWQLDRAWPASTTDSIVAVVDSTLAWQLVDRRSGQPIEDQRLPGTLNDSSLWLSTSQSTDLIARITETGDRQTLTVVGGGMRAPRIRQIDEPLIPLRFTEDGMFFVFTNRQRSALTFMDWYSGAGYTVSLPEGHRLIGFYLG